MTRCAFAIPGDLATPTGGYAYARKIMHVLAKKMEIEVCGLPAAFPFPSSADLNDAFAALKACDNPGSVFLFDGLAFGAMPAELLKQIDAPIVALVHHPLGLEEGLNEEQKQKLLASEKTALTHARHVIVTSAAMAQAVIDLFGVDAGLITIAEPGVEKRERAAESENGSGLHIVSIGALVPRKGFDVLVDALARVKDLSWHVTIAGSLDRAPQTTAQLQAQIAAHVLTDRIQLVGTLDETQLSSLYASADIFALATHYEGYGMVFAEAMAHGLPIVASGGGAVKDTVPQTAGLHVPAGDAAAFSRALKAMLSDAELRGNKAEGAWLHSRSLPAWDETAAVIGDVLRRAGG